MATFVHTMSEFPSVVEYTNLTTRNFVRAGLLSPIADDGKSIHLQMDET